MSVPKRSWLVMLLAGGGGVLAAGERFTFDMPGQPVSSVTLYSRLANTDLPDPIPLELIMEITVTAPEIGAAVHVAETFAIGLSALLGFFCNAHVEPPIFRLAYDTTADAAERELWQVQDEPMRGHIRRSARLMPMDVLGAFLQATATGPSRGQRAIGQYDQALRHWTTAARPLALAHLYICLETLGPLVEARERTALGLLTDREHAQHRGVDLTKSNWKEVLLGWVRRDVICRGDKITYDAARKASDGFEHGFKDFAHLSQTADAVSTTLIGYLREELATVLDLPAPVRDWLMAREPIDVTPLRRGIRVRLEGGVADPFHLGQGDGAHPGFDMALSVIGTSRNPDDTLAVEDRIDWIARLADGINWRLEGTTTSIGLNDGAAIYRTGPPRLLAEASVLPDDPAPHSPGPAGSLVTWPLRMLTGWASIAYRLGRRAVRK